MESRGLTPIIASHNLRELEDICDLVGLLHKGGILFSKDLIEMKMNMQKVQCVAETKEELDALLTDANILKIENRGKLYTITLRETKETTEKIFGASNIIYYEIIPLSLEEIFINETEEVGYDIKRIILD
jgi:ABC-2 type transport system ATP-binding protein